MENVKDVKELEYIKGIFDTHAHYNDEKFENNREEMIKYVHENGVDYICNVGASFKDSEDSIKLAASYSFIYCSVGVHPFYAENLEEGWCEKFIELANNKKVVAIGEAGLDYSSKSFSKERQFEVFEKQLDIAQSLNLPVIIHSRDAAQDTLSIIKNFPNVKGVIHCFSGDDVLALKYIDMGWYLGFTGVLTFKNANKTVRAVCAAPIERVVIETDCPYMAPEPLRGSVCNSVMLKFVVKKISEVKNISVEEVLYHTKFNAFNLYKIKL